MGRASCARCDRPEPVCVCSALPANGAKIKLQTKILVIQHPCESKKKNIGTVPLMQLCLDNCEVLVAKGCGQSEATSLRGRRGRKYEDEKDGEHDGYAHGPQPEAVVEGSMQSHNVQIQSSIDEIQDDSIHSERFGKKLEKKGESWSLEGNRALEEALGDKETLLLYPGPGAIDIETLETLSDGGKGRTLIVVDGTWRQAGRVMREAECLTRAVAAGTVRRVQFASAGASGYQFRREPHGCRQRPACSPRAVSAHSPALTPECVAEHCLSTLESVAYSLQFLEGPGERERAVWHLQEAFQLMVRLQTRHIPATPDKLRPHHSPALPPAPPPAAAAAGGEGSDGEGAANGVARRREYALFRGATEARTGRTRFEQEGEPWRCTYDQAAAHCRAVNALRPRGLRLTVLPWPRPEDSNRPPALSDNPPSPDPSAAAPDVAFSGLSLTT